MEIDGLFPRKMKSSLNPLRKEGLGIRGLCVNSSSTVDKEGDHYSNPTNPTQHSLCHCNFQNPIAVTCFQEKVPTTKESCVVWDSYNYNEL